MTSAEHPYVFVGTPFVQGHGGEKEVFKPIWQQEAKDERGRKRFHGAFTGGFSAGYFNTVGTKEGNEQISTWSFVYSSLNDE